MSNVDEKRAAYERAREMWAQSRPSSDTDRRRNRTAVAKRDAALDALLDAVREETLTLVAEHNAAGRAIAAAIRARGKP